MRVADAGLQAFRMTIEAVVTLTGRPGVYLGGAIESGVVQVGDRLDLMDDGQLIKVVTCDGLGSVDRIGGTSRCLPGVHCISVSRGEIREGQVLAGAELRREEDAALPRSLSAPVYRRQTAAATAFADRHAPLLASQADSAPPLAAREDET
jgi:translation elongation factor EF-Tu-like GTPase